MLGLGESLSWASVNEAGRFSSSQGGITHMSSWTRCGSSAWRLVVNRRRAPWQTASHRSRDGQLGKRRVRWHSSGNAADDWHRCGARPPLSRSLRAKHYGMAYASPFLRTGCQNLHVPSGYPSSSSQHYHQHGTPAHGAVTRSVGRVTICFFFFLLLT